MLQAKQLLQGRYYLQQSLGQNAGRQTWLAQEQLQTSSQQVIVKLLAFSPQMHYQLKQQLRSNAGRQTWLAVDLASQTKERVIVKLLPFSPQIHWDNLKLFEREAQVLKHLNHSRIPKYRDYFSTEPSNSGDLPWFGLVQDYIPGYSLQQLLKKDKRFTEAQAMRKNALI